MVFEATLIDVGIAFLVAVALAEYFKFRSKADKGFGWLAVAGVWLLFAGSFAAAGTLGTYLGTGTWGLISNLFEVVGWIFALIGTIFVAYETLVER